MNLVTLDIWDTVVRRNCHPDDVKNATAQYIVNRLNDNLVDKYSSLETILLLRQNIELELGRKSQAVGFDDEYNVRDVLVALVNKISINKVSEDVVNDALEREIIFELDNTYIDPTIYSFISELNYDKCFFISDFYHDTAFIKRLLNHHNVDFVKEGISSCDVGYNKRSGRLFDWFFENNKDLIDSCSNHIHVGDNEWSDYSVPQKKGVDARLYLPEIEHKKRVEIAGRYHKASELVQDFSKNRLQNSSFSIGEEHALFYYAYCREIIANANANSLDKVFFMTREGEFFKKVYDEINSALPELEKGPISQLLCVSRIATFFPSLRSISTEELMRVWNLYSTQSIQALFKTLGLDIELYTPFENKYSLPKEEEVQYPWLDERVNRLFSDQDFTTMMLSQQSQRRLALSDYFTSIGLVSGGNYGLVDIGWRGTIQDNIAYIQPDSKFTGYYLGLERYLNEQPNNGFKIAFGPNNNHSENQSDLFNIVAPIEMICNSENGSVVGYDDSIPPQPIRKIDPNENVIFSDFTSDYQRGVLANIGDISSSLANLHNIHDAMKSEALKIWRGIIDAPSPLLADAYFSLVHNEEFGLGKAVDKSQRIYVSDILKALVNKDSRLALKTKLRSLFWPQGYFKRTDISKFEKFFSYYVLKFAILYNKIRIRLSRNK
ncbi:hypothetical protein AB9R81_10395 [Vibrio cyclitrophicus]|nr:hypothetical protein [Vibrio cyclitrophicus]PMI06537.1 hypothetical protein BCU52_17610 [Vibrio cyclitrophicus]